MHGNGGPEWRGPCARAPSYYARTPDRRCAIPCPPAPLPFIPPGQLFPDNDPKWKGANSDIFLKEAVRLMEEAGYTLGNLDATIIAQKPKLSPHKARGASGDAPRAWPARPALVLSTKASPFSLPMTYRPAAFP